MQQVGVLQHAHESALASRESSAAVHTPAALGVLSHRVLGSTTADLRCSAPFVSHAGHASLQ